jgi:cytochrome c peroxidase|tara:strand:- start:482 stop:592 length:111 start_codon:yes stop_codon:yes gene_type:complete
MAKALEFFEVILITPEALFDRYFRRDTYALNITEKE